MKTSDRIAKLERCDRKLPTIGEIPERDSPPSEKELRELQKKLAMPESVFLDLFGDKLRVIS